MEFGIGLDTIKGAINENAGVIAVGVGSAIVGAGVGALAVSKLGKHKTRRRKKHNHKNKRTRSHKHKRKGRRHYPRTAGKRKDTSHRRIRYTKKGQPYVILRSGKARFISMRSASSSHRRKGGKY